ncbi:hypothetical protein [Streptomyces sp. SID5473]|uniref:hypothetical protein n=1 Tax=Streptomyces sp. SID5473 TaxID=2690299 RepID=UPI001F379FBD|nr:hypothetical protein [Streptomyces sp. SID5473]
MRDRFSAVSALAYAAQSARRTARSVYAVPSVAQDSSSRGCVRSHFSRSAISAFSSLAS